MFGRQRSSIAATVLLIAAWMATPQAAQITTGTIAGTAVDAQGAVLPGATAVLISETRGLRSTPAVAGATGEFVFVNIAPDTYTVEVSMPSFITQARRGVTVSPGERLALPVFSLQIGTSETVTVTSEATLVQAQSGERSFTIAPDAVANLPLPTRNFAQLAELLPGVVMGANQTPQRAGGGGASNLMMDGVSTMDTGSNRLLMQVNVESIAEVRVLASGYQAEYGRSSGLQITAVTKSGSNRFHGSAYDVERNSDWNANSRTNILNGNAKSVTKQREWGFSLGGPVGKPGGQNKVFFFFAQEFQPRSSGNNVVRFRVPTALERAGDFSQTTDNNGTLYNLIRDHRTGLPCTTTNTAGCFQAGGVLGRIPQADLYPVGLTVLNQYPLPNLEAQAGRAWNYEITRPVENLLAWQPILRVDYQQSASLRATFKHSAWQQRKQTVNGSLPGYNDTRIPNPQVRSTAVTINYTISPTMFLEGTYGFSKNEQAGCALLGNGPNFCNAAIPVSPQASLLETGLTGLPLLFPDATRLNPDYYAFDVMNTVNPPMWQDGKMWKVPNFTWGNRIGNAPPNIPFPGFLNTNPSQDFSVSLTKVAGQHTFKGGFYNTYSFKAENIGTAAFGTLNFANNTNNIYDTSFGYANAAFGILNSIEQGSQYSETSTVYYNTEGYIQDNWRVNRQLTLDYGVRFVHQHAQYDRGGLGSNFLPNLWDSSQAPALYRPVCANGAASCSGATRQALNPVNGELGPAALIGTRVPGSGDVLNGLLVPGITLDEKETFQAPALVFSPRFGVAYDITGNQRLVARGGVGLFFDRPSSTTFAGGVNNPPTAGIASVQFLDARNIGGGGLTTDPVPALNAFEYDAKVPSSTQWNAGVQTVLPWATSLDVSYVGQHSFNTPIGVNINAVNYGAAFLPENRDPTSASGALLPDVLVRSIRGYGNVTQQQYISWRTYHSIQLAFQRRFQNGLSFGFNDTIALSDHELAPPRLDTRPDGSYVIRADQDEAQRLLGDRPVETVHVLRANMVWDLPDLEGGGTARTILAQVVNDWQLSAVWNGRTGTAYNVGFSYQSGGGNVDLTGSPTHGARIRIPGDAGSGCSGDVYRQFDADAFAGPLVGSVGLESGMNYLRGCFYSAIDLAIARNIRLGGGRSIQLRAEIFNVPNAAIITNRNTTLNFSSPSDPLTVNNLPFDANGNLVDARSRPSGAGVGVATDYQSPRSVQLQVRFQF